jgi:hypothetical protein
MLWAPCVATVLARHLNKKVTTAIAAVLALSAFPYVLYNNQRPLIGNSSVAERAFFTGTGIFHSSRANQYFNRRRAVSDSYLGAVRTLKSQGCSQIGLVLRNTKWEIIDDWEYPLWVLLNADETRTFRLQHVMVENVSSKKNRTSPFNNFRPCAVIAMGSIENVDHDGIVYGKTWSSDDVSVFLEKQ